MGPRIWDLDDLMPLDIESAVLSRQVPILHEERDHRKYPTGLMFVHDYPPYNDNEQSE